MNRRSIFCFSLLLTFFLQFSVLAQTASDSINYCPEKSFSELFKKKDSIAVLRPTRNNFFLIIPIIGSQPATGFSYGFVSQYTFKGKQERDKYSSVNLGVIYTEKKQLLINAKNANLHPKIFYYF